MLNAAVRLNLSHRRNHSSLSAAAIFLACALQGVRLTQHDFCLAIGLTEVTLRKVNKELGAHWRRLVPKGYKEKAIPAFLARHGGGREAEEEKSGREAAGQAGQGSGAEAQPGSSDESKEAAVVGRSGGPDSDLCGWRARGCSEDAAAPLSLRRRGPPLLLAGLRPSFDSDLSPREVGGLG